MFGFSNLKELPDLPRYKLDENRQIVIDEIIEENENKVFEEKQTEDPSPKREENTIENKKENEEEIENNE